GQSVFPPDRQGAPRSQTGATQSHPPVARCAATRRRSRMTTSEPPMLMTWLLERLASCHRCESLIGDLREQFHDGRSAWWYRRQVVTTIVAGVAGDVRAHKLQTAGAFITSCAVFLLLAAGSGALRHAVVIQWQLAPLRPETLRQAVVYYGLPFEIIVC